MPAPCRVSVVIPTYNRLHHVERLLRAISAQTLSVTEFEVIVSIYGSDDGTREIVDEPAVPYRLQAIWHPRQGRAAAHNAAFESPTATCSCCWTMIWNRFPDCFTPIWMHTREQTSVLFSAPSSSF
jgi:glycosyltransferase involved in cell wall biosynthesis